MMIKDIMHLYATSVENDLFLNSRLWLLKGSAFLLKEQKKSLAKENSPAGEKLPEFHSYWQ